MAEKRCLGDLTIGALKVVKYIYNSSK